jgi:hypothetical protein
VAVITSVRFRARALFIFLFAKGRNLETVPGDGGSSLSALEPRQNFKISNHPEDAAPFKNVFTPNLKEWVRRVVYPR